MCEVSVKGSDLHQVARISEHLGKEDALSTGECNAYPHATNARFTTHGTRQVLQPWSRKHAHPTWSWKTDSRQADMQADQVNRC